jgi:hypothetical protein
LNEEGKLGPASWKSPHPHPPSTKGRKAITDGVVTRLLKEGEILPDGFVYGLSPTRFKKLQSIGHGNKGRPGRKGEKQSAAHIAKRVAKRKGKKFNPTQRENQSIAHGGKSWTEEKRAVEWQAYNEWLVSQQKSDLE